MGALIKQVETPGPSQQSQAYRNTKRSVCAIELEHRCCRRVRASARQANADEMRLLPGLGRLFFDPR